MTPKTRSKTVAAGTPGAKRRRSAGKAAGEAAGADGLAVVMVPVGALEAHPDARAYGESRDARAEAEDQAALNGDVKACGILTPLDIVSGGTADAWRVIDGCRRLEAARAAGMAAVPCVVRKAVADVRAYTVSKNAMRRRLSCGERLMRWVDLRRREVAEAWRAGGRQARGEGGLGGRGNRVSRDTGFSAQSIASRLGCGKKEALAAMQIAACMEFGLKPERNAASGALAFSAATEAERAAVTAAYGAVISGTAPIRRWVAAYSGKAAAGRRRGQAGTDWAAVADRSARALKGAFRHWQDADWTCGVSRLKVERQIADMLDAMADCVGTDIMVRTMRRNWSPEMIQEVVRGAGGEDAAEGGAHLPGGAPGRREE
jgi:hypothetical protein